MVGGIGEGGIIIRAWTGIKIARVEKGEEYVLIVLEGNYFTLSNIIGRHASD